MNLKIVFRMKKRTLTHFVLFLLLLVNAPPGLSRDIAVSPDGEIKTITRALELAKAGDRIVVQPGVYAEENILVDKSVQLIGIDYPEVDGQGKHQVFTVSADSVTIRGFLIKNAGLSFMSDNAAIKVENVFGCVIEGNKLRNNYFGIYLANSGDCRIINNDIQSSATREATSGNGIHLWYCKDIIIEGNSISGHRDGIYFEFVEDSRILNNLSEHNLRYGLHFMFSHRCKYTGNIFRHNGAGVAVMYTKYVEMCNNRFENNWGSASFGILLKEIMDSRIHHNIFYKNSIGLYAEGSNRIYVEKNTFEQNGWAVKIMANSMENRFTENNFIENTFDVATNSKQNFNLFEGNYWSHYRGYDLNRDGVGDVPYRPVRLFSFVVQKQAAALILLRSVFVDMLDLAESMIPILTPETLVDKKPMMRKFHFETVPEIAEFPQRKSP